MTVYIAGPMSGFVEYNKDAFFQAEEMLEHDSMRTLNPARFGIIPGYTDYRDYWPINEAMLRGADAIFMLEGWQDSLGAKNEYAWAVAHGLMILNADGKLLQGIGEREPVPAAQ